jgi:hypothetical protein
VIESALIETSVARNADADVAGSANPIRSVAEQMNALAGVANIGRRY